MEDRPLHVQQGGVEPGRPERAVTTSPCGDVRSCMPRCGERHSLTIARIWMFWAPGAGCWHRKAGVRNRRSAHISPVNDHVIDHCA